MIYYRTHASRPENRPAELEGWAPSVGGYGLESNTVGEYKVLGIVQPLQYTPPENGWVSIGGGWETAPVGEFSPTVLANPGSRWKVIPEEVDGNTWFLPCVLNAAGGRAFEVRYGGQDFLPMLSEKQAQMVALANEVRTCMESSQWPDMSIRARWAASFLTLPYHMSTQTVGALGLLSESLIAAVLTTAVGHGSHPE